MQAVSRPHLREPTALDPLSYPAHYGYSRERCGRIVTTESQSPATIPLRRQPTGQIRWAFPGHPHLLGKRSERQSAGHRGRSDQCEFLLWIHVLIQQGRDIAVQVVATASSSHFYSQESVDASVRAAQGDRDFTMDGYGTPDEAGVRVWRDVDEWSVSFARIGYAVILMTSGLEESRRSHPAYRSERDHLSTAKLNESR